MRLCQEVVVAYITNQAELQAWCLSSDGLDTGRSLFTIEYSDGRRSPVIVERDASGGWKYWSGHGWSSPRFRTRNGAARALVILVEEFERYRVTMSGVRWKFDARAILRERGMKK